MPHAKVSDALEGGILSESDNDSSAAPGLGHSEVSVRYCTSIRHITASICKTSLFSVFGPLKASYPREGL